MTQLHRGIFIVSLLDELNTLFFKEENVKLCTAYIPVEVSDKVLN